MLRRYSPFKFRASTAHSFPCSRYRMGLLLTVTSDDLGCPVHLSDPSPLQHLGCGILCGHASSRANSAVLAAGCRVGHYLLYIHDRHSTASYECTVHLRSYFSFQPHAYGITLINRAGYTRPLYESRYRVGFLPGPNVSPKGCISTSPMGQIQ